MAKNSKKLSSTEPKLIIPGEIDFEILVGQDAQLYLHKPDLNRFQLGRLLFEVLEDEEDGYRSSMKEVRIVEEVNTVKSRLLDHVCITKSKSVSDGYALVGKQDFHIWLEFGTDETDSYYPMFIFKWNPRLSPIQNQLQKLINQ